MVPIYATDSWLSLVAPQQSVIFDLMRDCYEAYCIFCFFGLMVIYVERTQEQEVGRLLEGKPKLPHPFPLCFLPRITLGRKFLRQCYQFILQFVIIKPLLSVISVSLYFGDRDHYDEENIFKANNGYLWLTVIENISITISLYYLVLYYMAVKEELAPFSPVGKFLCIKAVIFFSFWQGVVINILANFNVVHQTKNLSEANVGRVIQDFAICIEMFALSIIHHKVFPYRQFRDPNKVPFLYDPKTKHLFVNPVQSMRPVLEHFANVASVTDVLEDTRKSFLVPLTASGEGIIVGVVKEGGTDENGEEEESFVIIDEYAPLLNSTRQSTPSYTQTVTIIKEDTV